MDALLNLLNEPFVAQLIVAFIIVTLILIIKSIVGRRLTHIIKDTNNSYKTKKAVSAFGYLLILFALSLIYREQLGSLTVFFGIAGAGIAFALQEVIISIAGWISILLTDTYKSGDRVLVGGIKGDVIDVGILRTTIMEISGWVEGDLYNGRIVRIANSYVFKEPVYNYSADFPFLWDEIKLPIQFGSNYQLTEKILLDAAEDVVGAYTREAEKHWEQMVRKYLIEDASTHPMVTIVVNDNWVEFTLRFVVDYKERVGIKDKLYKFILSRVENSSGQVAFASATFEITNTPTIDVNYTKQ